MADCSPGCAGGGHSSSGDSTRAIDSAPSSSSNARAAETETTSASDGTAEPDGYTVSIRPIGDVPFESVPKRWSNPGGPAYLAPQAGPILNLFNAERTVKQVYPDAFDADEELFDRQRVRDIVAGNV